MALLEEETNDRPRWGRVVVGSPHKPGGRDLSQAGQVGAHHTPGSPRLEPPLAQGSPWSVLCCDLLH